MLIFRISLIVTSLSGLYAKDCNSQSPFHLSIYWKTGKATQKLNAKFVTLTVDDPCKDGEQGCIKGSFAICDHGKYAVIPCGGNLTCFAMLTREIAASRIAATGATGGVEGDGHTENESTNHTDSSADSSMSQSNTTTIDDSQSGTGISSTETDEDETECEDTAF
ncbi:carbohydrate-binding module family 19 [Melampsora americana]|nr:carbohydrate-binding module family 19 [Melampsora americana]